MLKQSAVSSIFVFNEKNIHNHHHFDHIIPDWDYSIAGILDQEYFADQEGTDEG